MKTASKLLPLLAGAALALSAPGALRADDAPAAPPPAAAPKAETQLPPRLEQRIQFLDQNLKFTSDQKTQVTQIFTKAWEQMRSENAGSDQEDRRARWQKMRAAMQEAHKQVRALLTPEQQKTFDTLPQGRRGGRGGPPA